VPEIQAIIRELSSLERPGLGTRDYLKVVPEIDELFFFFRQWLHYVELDVPVTRPAAQRNA
jgi:hypothetical protein